MLKTGVFLQNRYEIISRIGSGGMADVYKARDHKLNRFVAVKVLKSEYKDDKAFLSKFRVEAQAAAGLAHANIVNVYDVGEDRGVSFIVMELVEGITLKSYIGKKGKLSVREATSIALQVCAGLDAAHNNGIVHRDVKPQNILISMDGKAKIADFGIARAANSNTINSNVMGSVHYSAPEQTRGGYADEKSDIYSMGITMYEMLTGRVPFDGDSTVEVALKHLQEEVPSPAKFTPEIPRSTEQIVMKCSQKSPDRRYSNMSELIRDLKESLVNPNGNFVSLPTVDHKAHTVMLSKEEVSQIKNGSLPAYDRDLYFDDEEPMSGKGTMSGPDGRIYPYGRNYYQNMGTDRQAGPAGRGGRMDYMPDEEPLDDDSYYYDDYEEPERRRPGFKDDYEEGRTFGEKLVLGLSITAAVLVGLFVLIFAAKSFGLFNRFNGNPVNTQVENSSGIEVPKILGLTEKEAQDLLREKALGYKYLGETPSTEYAKGQVVSQSIEMGSFVEKNTTVGYILSSGSSEVLTVPILENNSQEEAEKALTSMGLLVSVDTSRYSNRIAEGYVINTNPGAGSTVTAGDTVTIYVSQGQETSTVEVPAVTGHYVSDAQTMLTNYGLYAYIVTQPSETIDKDIVISQDIDAGVQVQTGTAVTITVSEGSGQVQPDADGTGVWKCNAQLNAPEGFQGEPCRIELMQDGETEVIYEGTTTFPYILNIEGKPGVSTGTVYIRLLNAQTWEVTTTYEYPDVSFEQQ